MTTELKINDELRDLIDIPSEQERTELERSIKQDGIRDAIVVWLEENTIIDGHNRYNIAKANDLEFTVKKMSFKNIDDVKEWMIQNQLARRNLNPQRFHYYIGLLYNKEKQSGGQREKMDKDTSEVIGEKHGVSDRQVRRDGDYAAGVDVISSVPDFIGEAKAKIAKAKILDGKVFTKGEIEEIGKIAKKEPEKAKVVTKELAKIHAANKEVKERVRSTKEVVKKKEANNERYEVAFVEPQFDRIGFNIASEPRPPLAENAVAYLACDDENLAEALELFKKWGLSYAATYVYPVTGYEGIWSDVKHTFLLVGTKGTIAGPKAKDAFKSVGLAGNTGELMIKMIEKYHPKVTKKLDMSKAPAKGWETLS